MATGDSLGIVEEQHPKREVNWMPLLIVIVAAYLISVSLWAFPATSWNYGYKLEFQLGIVLSFLAGAVLVATIALVIFSREGLAKKSLIVGMIILICLLAIKTEVYLRATL